MQPAGGAVDPRRMTSTPVLAAGRHRSPRTGTCFMEHASVLCGAPWSDDPKITHPLLATLARHVNDHSSDAGRQRLVRLVPLVVTGHRTDPATGHRLVRRLVLRALPFARGPRQRTLYVALLAADDACGPDDADRDRHQVALLLRAPDDGLRAALGLRRAHAGRAVYGEQAMHAAVQLAVGTLADAGPDADPDALLHDLLADAIALVRGEERLPDPRPATAWVRAGGVGVRAR